MLLYYIFGPEGGGLCLYYTERDRERDGKKGRRRDTFGKLVLHALYTGELDAVAAQRSV